MLVNLLRSLRDRYRYSRDPIGTSRSMGVKIGENCRLLCGPSAFGSEPFLISLGDHVTVTSGVQFITHDGGVWIFRSEFPEIDVFGPIEVGSNVFIGYRAIIMPGVKIGNNCVIGAGAVVTRSIPDKSVAVGVPAKVLKSVDDYWSSVEEISTHFRSLPQSEKREKILRHLGKSL